MDIQDEEQDHVAIEMDFLDGPFADRAQLPALPREGTRQHRIAPDEPVGVLDGRQVRRYVVRGPELEDQKDYILDLEFLRMKNLMWMMYLLMRSESGIETGKSEEWKTGEHR
ncbi:hypothetical protein HNY73_002065 [Argiope bruennichi]|uniref:Uncharacterized protein n=1 Tax=Argiope bruennichi TaxID=94029 RepID=A0A8T0FTR0_ARGBR|nr:hypothetical protein HNY73_002065 [Argiope bruennichi]